MRTSGSPRVTVAIPTRNRASLLKECLRSVLEQSLTDIEVYVSDNASTDDTAAVVASFDDPRVHHAPLERNIGLYPNWSRCLRLGTAPNVAVLSDDDLMLPGNLDRKSRLLDQNPNLGIVHSAIEETVIGSNVRVNLNRGGSDVDVIEPGSIVVRKLLTEPYWIEISAAVIRRSVIGGEYFDESDRDPADLGFALRLARKTDVAYLAEPLVTRRVHSGAASVQRGVLDLEAGDQATPGIEALCYRVRKRFLTRYGREFPDLSDLRRRCRLFGQISVLSVLKRRLGPDRSPRMSWRSFREVATIAPELLVTRRAARFLAGSLVGTRGRELVRGSAGLKRRPTGHRQ